jgi:uncharacterized protein (DUF4415 family)
MSEEHIVSYTAAQIKQMIANGESKTDWTRLDTQTDADIDAACADDPDWKDIPHDWWKDAKAHYPRRKQQTTLRVDAEVLAWFKAQGKGWHTHMNAALKAYKEAKQQHQAL